MSRRRAPRKGPMKREIVITVVCSDKGQHDPPRVLGKVEITGDYVTVADFTRRVKDPYDLRHIDDYTTFRDGHLGPHTTDRFVCYKCGRDIPIRRDKLVSIARTLDENGHHRLDLSHVAAMLGD